MEREALCFPCAWKLLCVHKSNESLKYNHMLIYGANTLVKDVIDVSLLYVAADQIQLASWWRSWKRSTLTATEVYKYVLVEISLRVTPSTLPCGVPIAHIVTSLLLYINICTADFLGCAADIRHCWERWREDRSDLSGWIFLCPTFCSQVLQLSCGTLLNCEMTHAGNSQGWKWRNRPCDTKPLNQCYHNKIKKSLLSVEEAGFGKADAYEYLLLIRASACIKAHSKLTSQCCRGLDIATAQLQRAGLELSAKSDFRRNKYDQYTSDSTLIWSCHPTTFNLNSIKMGLTTN